MKLKMQFVYVFLATILLTSPRLFAQDTARCYGPDVVPYFYSLSIQVDEASPQFQIPGSIQSNNSLNRIFGENGLIERDNLYNHHVRQERYETALLEIACMSHYQPEQIKAFQRAYLEMAPPALRNSKLAELLGNYLLQGDLDLKLGINLIETEWVPETGAVTDVIDALDKIAQLESPPAADAVPTEISNFFSVSHTVYAGSQNAWDQIRQWTAPMCKLAELAKLRGAIHGLTEARNDIVMTAFWGQLMANDAAMVRFQSITAAIQANPSLWNDPAMQDAITNIRTFLEKGNCEQAIIYGLNALWDNAAEIAEGTLTIAQTLGGLSILHYINQLTTLVTGHAMTASATVGWSIGLMALQWEFSLILDIERTLEHLEIAVCSATIAHACCVQTEEDCSNRVVSMYGYVHSASSVVEAFEWEDGWVWGAGETIDLWEEAQNNFTSILNQEYSFVCDKLAPVILDHSATTGILPEIHILFSEEMDTTTFETGIAAQGSLSGLHELNFEFDHNTFRCELSPIIPFSVGEDVTITVGTSVTDTSNNELPDSYIISFVVDGTRIEISENSGTSNDNILELGTTPYCVPRFSQFLISNSGTENLLLGSWISDNSVFSLLPENSSGTNDDITIAPGEQYAVTVEFNPEGVGSYSGTISIGSNDFEQPLITLTAIGTGIECGAHVELSAETNPALLGEEIILNARVRDGHGSPVSTGETVEFLALFDGQWPDGSTAYTNSFGVASVRFIPREAGVFGIIADHVESGIRGSMALEVRSVGAIECTAQFDDRGCQGSYHEYRYHATLMHTNGLPVDERAISWEVIGGTIQWGDDITGPDGEAIMQFQVDNLDLRTVTVIVTADGIGSCSRTMPVCPCCPPNEHPFGRSLGYGGTCMDINETGSRIALGNELTIKLIEMPSETYCSRNLTDIMHNGINDVAIDDDASHVGLASGYPERGIVPGSCPMSGGSFYLNTDKCESSRAATWVEGKLLLGHDPSNSRVNQFSLYNSSGGLLDWKRATYDRSERICALATRPDTNLWAGVSDGAPNDPPNQHNWVYYGQISGSSIAVQGYFATSFRNAGVCFSADGNWLVVGSVSGTNQINVYQGGNPSQYETSLSLGHGANHIAFSSDNAYMAVTSEGGSIITIFDTSSGNPSSWQQYCTLAFPDGCTGLDWLAGSHTLVASSTSEIRFAYLDDTTPPEVEITSPSDGHTTSDATVDVAGWVSDSNEVYYAQYRINSGAWNDLPLDGAGNFSETVTLIPGQNLIEVQVFDVAGWTGGASVSITQPVDDTGPIAVGGSTSPGGVIRPGTEVVVDVSVIDDLSGVDPSTVSGFVQSPDETDVASFSMSLVADDLFSGSWDTDGMSGGLYYVDIEATDRAGNESESENVVTIELNAAPAIEITSPSTDVDLLWGESFVLTWTASDPDSDAIVSLYLDVDQDPGNGFEPIPNGIGLGEDVSSLTVFGSDYQPGNYTVYVRASDEYGITEAWSAGRLLISFADCNTNGIPDQDDIASGFSLDCNGNLVPDECESAKYGDFDFDGHVTLDDFAMFETCMTGPCATGSCEPALYGDACCRRCDVERDGDVDLADFAELQRIMGEEPNPITVTIDLGDGIRLELVKIPHGTFTMGSGEYTDATPHDVTISQDFYTGMFEVTKAQWAAVMGTSPWDGQSYVYGDDNSPACYVSWNNALLFCQTLSATTGYTFRLPSEAEWEYSCRAHTTTIYHFGDDTGDLSEYAWWSGNAWNNSERYAHVVGLKSPNRFGLYDMHGNVWEYCNDWYDENYYSESPSTDPPGPTTGSTRVCRGGSCDSHDYELPAAHRIHLSPGYTHYGIGFRVLMDIPDCNLNGVSDFEDIENGTSDDCNSNGVPDECDLAGGTVQDCNTNGIPDECDIVDGFSVDDNGDGVPDECSLETLVLDLGSGVILEMVQIPGGSFLMGTESADHTWFEKSRPVHNVMIENGLYVGMFEVTQEQWQIVMGTSPSGFPGNDRPVEQVSWFEAQDFCSAVSDLTGHEIRLPSEAEWEYACRAGTTTKYFFGDEDSLRGDYIWYLDTIGDQTQPVGTKLPNAWGLYDMLGNVFEWCEDNWHDDYTNAPVDGSAWTTDGDQSQHVFRGGNWNCTGHKLYCAYRDRGPTDVHSAGHGFRVVASIPDCNQNGVSDAHDISDGTSLDCNTNGIPDECDIADGTSDDINSNGLPDECDPELTEVAFDLGGGVMLEAVRIEAGSFMMGTDSTDHSWFSSSRPVHSVTFENSFFMGRFEVTQEQWLAVMGTSPSYFSGCDDCPVEQVNWYEARDFCASVSNLIGYTVRLPSEAEWEYACRAGTTTKYFFGDDDSLRGDYIWYLDTIGDQTQPVGTKLPNDWGLYDMLGNVFEWCEDNWHGDYNGAPADGSAWTAEGDQSQHVFRGANWNCTGHKLYCAYRDRGSTGVHSAGHGFRVVIEFPE